MSNKLSKFGEAFVSYGSYHYDPINQWIHIVCVPIIAATMFCGLSYIPISYNFQGYRLGIDFLYFAALIGYYTTINVLFSIAMVVLSGLMLAGWNYAFAGMEEGAFFTWVAIIHVIAWIFQFIGHGVFEKRKPALLDNLTQIFNAPLFVVVEVLEKLGFVSDEMEQWKKIITIRVTQYREGQKGKQN